MKKTANRMSAIFEWLDFSLAHSQTMHGFFCWPRVPTRQWVGYVRNSSSSGWCAHTSAITTIPCSAADAVRTRRFGMIALHRGCYSLRWPFPRRACDQRRGLVRDVRGCPVLKAVRTVAPLRYGLSSPARRPWRLFLIPQICVTLFDLLRTAS